MSTFDSKIIRLCNRLDVKDTVIGLLGDSLKERDERVTMLRTIIKDNDKTIAELRKTLEGRDTIYETNLKTALAVKDTINADLCKAIEEQRDALNHLRGVAVDNYVNVKRVRP